MTQEIVFWEKGRRDERILNQEEIDELLAQLDVEEAHGESQPDCLAA